MSTAPQSNLEMLKLMHKLATKVDSLEDQLKRLQFKVEDGFEEMAQGMRQLAMMFEAGGGDGGGGEDMPEDRGGDHMALVESMHHPEEMDDYSAFDLSPADQSLERTTNPANTTQHTCARCNKTFQLLSSLRRHEKTKHVAEGMWTGPTSFDCDRCNRSYELKSSLQRHMRDSHHDGGGGGGETIV